MNKFLKLSALSLLVVSAPVLAQNTATDRSVESVTVNGEGRVNFAISGATVNPAGCNNSSLVIDPDVAARREWLALLLTAQASGATINAQVAPTAGDCANPNTANPGGRNPRVLNISVNEAG